MKPHTTNPSWALDQNLITCGVHAHLLAGILLSQNILSGTWCPIVSGHRYFPHDEDPAMSMHGAMQALHEGGFLVYTSGKELADKVSFEIIDPAYLTKGGDK